MYFNVKNIVAVHSCKGGVGKSTISVFLASTLASRGIKVGICDLDICGPSLAELFSINRDSVKWKELESSKLDSKGKCYNKSFDLSYSDECRSSNCNSSDNSMFLEPKEVNGIKIMSSEFLRPKNYSGYSAYRGPIIDQLCYEMVYKTDWKGVEYLILDLPPGTSDVVISLVENIHITGSILVTTPHILSNNDLVKGIKLFKDLDIPILSIVENMSYFKCNSCCNINHIFGPSSVDSICKEYQIEHFIKLPLMSSDRNMPMYNSNDNNKSNGMPTVNNISMISHYNDSISVIELLNKLVDYLENKLKFNNSAFKNSPQRVESECSLNSKIYYNLGTNKIDW